METSKTTNKFSAEVRGRAVRMVRERQGEQCAPTHSRFLEQRLWLLVRRQAPMELSTAAPTTLSEYPNWTRLSSEA